MRLRSFLLYASAALLAGCTPFGACTLIGCFDGLVVQLATPPAGAFRVEAIVPGDPAEHVIECTSAQACELIFRDLVAPQVSIRITTAAGTSTQQFQPRYENLYPNGRRCGPSCRQATVTVQPPA